MRTRDELLDALRTAKRLVERYEAVLRDMPGPRVTTLPGTTVLIREYLKDKFYAVRVEDLIEDITPLMDPDDDVPRQNIRSTLFSMVTRGKLKKVEKGGVVYIMPVDKDYPVHEPETAEERLSYMWTAEKAMHDRLTK